MRWTAVLAVLLAMANSCATPEVGARQEMRVPTGDDVVEIAIVDRVNENGVVLSADALDPALVPVAPEFADLDDTTATQVRRDVEGYDVVIGYRIYPVCAWAPEIRVDDDGATIRLHLRSFADCGGKQAEIAVQRLVGIRFAAGVDPDTIVATHEMVS